jgi:hypothetical protein
MYKFSKQSTGRCLVYWPVHAPMISIPRKPTWMITKSLGTFGMPNNLNLAQHSVGTPSEPRPTIIPNIVIGKL